MKGWTKAAAGTLLGAASCVNEAAAQDPLYSGTVSDYPATIELRSYANIGLDGEGLKPLEPIYLVKAFPKADKATFWAYVGQNMGVGTGKEPFSGAGFMLKAATKDGEIRLHTLPTAEWNGTEFEGVTAYTTLELYKMFLDCNPSVRFGPDGPQYSATFNVGRKAGKFDVALSSGYGPEGWAKTCLRLARNIDGFYVDLGAGIDPMKPSDVYVRFSISGAIGEKAGGKVKSFKPKPPKPHLLGASSGHSRYGTQAGCDDRQHRRNVSTCSYNGWDGSAHYRKRGR